MKEDSRRPDSGSLAKRLGREDEVLQFQRRPLNWDWHSSMVSWAALRIESVKSKFSLQKSFWRRVQPIKFSHMFRFDGVGAFSLEIELKRENFLLVLEKKW